MLTELLVKQTVYIVTGIYGYAPWHRRSVPYRRGEIEM